MTTDSRPPTADPPEALAAPRRDGSRLAGVLVLALAARLMVMILWRDNLVDDRDGYLALAEGLAEGRGFSNPGTTVPTAHRPPLYPLTLVPSVFLPSGFWVAMLHAILGVATVWLTWLLAVRLTISQRERGQGAIVPLLAALFVAVDPILLRYVTFPMTETLATFLVTGLLVTLTTGENAFPPQWRSVLTGVLFGMAALCRPAVWAFAALFGLWGIVRRVAGRHRSVARSGSSAKSLLSTNPSHGSEWNWWLVAAGASIVVLPWVVRNSHVLGHPIVMTTHGGYTLLLGNNPAFDREVVTQPWGTVWDGSHGGGQAQWAAQLNRTMDEAGLTTEVTRDRWMNERARANILADPGAFARACWLRLRRFWGIVPVQGASDQPPWLRWGTGTIYSLLFVGALAGLLNVCRQHASAWGPSLLMTATLMSVHVVYWTNTRMRAPIVPVIAILAAIGWSRLVRTR